MQQPLVGERDVFRVATLSRGARLTDSLDQLTVRLREFAQARGWEHLHTAKNLTAAVAGEAGELVAILQWVAGDTPLDANERAALADELADVLIYLVRLADVTGIDLIRVANEKADRNDRRFPLSS